MVGGNGGNQFRQYAGQNVRNQNRYNEVQTVWNQVFQNAVQNPGIQNVGNQNRLIVVPRIANQNLNGNGNVVAKQDEGNAIRNNGDLDEIEEVNANQILMANLQQASTSGTQTDKAPIYDSDGSAEEAAKFVRDFKSLTKEAAESLAKHKALEFEIERLLREVASLDIMYIVQSNSVVDTSNLQTELDCTKQKLENFIIKKEKEYVVIWNNWCKKCEECQYDKISYEKAYNDMQQKFERLQAQLGDLKGKSKDTPCKSDTLDPLSQKLENENISEQKYITKGKSVNTKFANQSTERKPSLQYLTNNFVVRQPNAFQSERPKFSKTRVPPKAVKTNDLLNLVTSNSVPTTTESKVVTNDKMIAPGMFRINSFKTSKEDKFMPINKVRASVRTNPITVSQPHVITTKHVNSDLNGLFSIGVDNTAKTRRPQPRSNTKNDRDIQICLWCVDSGCSKHMIGNLKLLINFVWKFLGTIRFGNDHVAAILGYGYLQWGNILITKVYLVKGLGHNLFSIGQFCDSDLEVAFRGTLVSSKTSKELIY
ncbi:hypothetical protein Tco_1176754 [Tanacetum coccineum]